MAATLRVVDEQPGSTPRRRAGVDLRIASEQVSAREIIRSRVLAELEELNMRKPSATHSYIIPQDLREQVLNSVGTNAQRAAAPLDVDAEIERAIGAFNRRRFIMLLDDRQIADVNQVVGLRPDSEVVFVHLMPLKGG